MRDSFKMLEKVYPEYVSRIDFLNENDINSLPLWAKTALHQLKNKKVIIYDEEYFIKNILPFVKIDILEDKEVYQYLGMEQYVGKKFSINIDTNDYFCIINESQIQVNFHNVLYSNKDFEILNNSKLIGKMSIQHYFSIVNDYINNKY